MDEKQPWIQEIGADGLTFGERLKDLIVGKNITAKQLSIDTGIKESAISAYQNASCTRVPRSDVVLTLSRYFNVSADYLFGLTHVKGSDDEVKLACTHTGLHESTVAFLHEIYHHQTPLSDTIVSIIDRFLRTESNSRDLTYWVGSAIHSAQNCKTLEFSNMQVLSPNTNGSVLNELETNAQEHGMMLWPPDVSANQCIDKASEEVSKIVKEVLKEQCLRVSNSNGIETPEIEYI